MLRVEGGGVPEPRIAGRDAVERGGVRLGYQPVVDLVSGELVGTEALLRLTDLGGRAVDPAMTVADAEGTGWIVELGVEVRRAAVTQVARWWEATGTLLPTAVNVSSLELRRAGFAREVLALLAEVGVPPQALVLELTESVLLPGAERPRHQLAELVEAGVGLALDDFGTGHASLSYLLELPATSIKIDRSFVVGVPHQARSTAIVSSVAALAADCGLACVAEGIETVEQRDFLRGLGVRGQGHLFGRALPAAEILARLVPPVAGVPVTGGSR